MRMPFIEKRQRPGEVVRPLGDVPPVDERQLNHLGDDPLIHHDQNAGWALPVERLRVQLSARVTIRGISRKQQDWPMEVGLAKSSHEQISILETNPARSRRESGAERESGVSQADL